MANFMKFFLPPPLEMGKYSVSFQASEILHHAHQTELQIIFNIIINNIN